MLCLLYDLYRLLTINVLYTLHNSWWYFLCGWYLLLLVSEEDTPRDQAEVENIPERIKAHGDILQKVENRQFSFNELEKFTNRFERLIGQGGFGPVYFGRLEDNAEVAVKIRSESSSHGITEFFAEVLNSLRI